MKKILFIATALFFGAKSMAQTADFENQLSQDTAWFGQDQVFDGDTTFTSGGFTFENNYNAAWASFTGWAYSNTTDVVTPGYTNQFSNITGTGESSNQFGICYTVNNRRLFSSNGIAFNPHGAYFTNTTYAYLSMLNGDAYGKQFGNDVDANGNDDGTNGEDWFLLTIYGLNADSTHTGDSVNFYLADYRFADPNDDYLVNSWEWVDLSSLGLVYGLDFELNSTDVGDWGMNTPSYFAMDNLSGSFAGVNESIAQPISCFPNPTVGEFAIKAPVGSVLTLYNFNGQLIKAGFSTTTQTNWNISDLEAGIYVLRVENNGEISTQKIIKQ